MRRHCNMWRNYEDIQPTWPSLAATIEYWGSLGCVDNDYHRNRCVKFPNGFKSIAGPIDDFVAAAGQGGWNDPDQVLVGQTCDPIPPGRAQLCAGTRGQRLLPALTRLPRPAGVWAAGRARRRKPPPRSRAGCGASS